MRLIAQAAAPTQRKPGKDKRDKKRDKRDNRRDKRDKKKGSAADGSESEEGFGDDGADWEVYRAMDMRDSDSGGLAGCRVQGLGGLRVLDSGLLVVTVRGRVLSTGHEGQRLECASRGLGLGVKGSGFGCGNSKAELYTAIDMRDNNSGGPAGFRAQGVRGEVRIRCLCGNSQAAVHRFRHVQN